MRYRNRSSSRCKTAKEMWRRVEMDLHPGQGVAIVPPHLPTTDEERTTEQAGPSRLTWGVRSALVFVVVLLTGLFSVAIWLDPYDAAGKARTIETHRQLGLPECTFKNLTGKPCPSCGMTTSFSLLIHGDPVNAWKANE